MAIAACRQGRIASMIWPMTPWRCSMRSALRKRMWSASRWAAGPPARLALRRPSRVASLGLITTSYMADAAERQSRLERVAAVQRDGVAGQHDYNMARWFTEQALRDQLPGARTMSAAYRAFSPQAFEWISHAILHDVDDADKLQNLTMPTLIVASPDDPGVPRQASEYMRDAIPNAEFHWLGPAKHLATLEHPERFNQILVDFLARHAR